MQLLGENQSCGGRGLKKPGWPNITVVSALARFCHSASGPAGADGHISVVAVMSSQKLCKRCTRCSGALPAIIAALMAPMEIPATQSGEYSEDASASYTPA